MNATQRKDVRNEILARAQEDHLQLCDVISVLVEADPSLGDSDLKAEALAIIQELMVDGLISAGDVRSDNDRLVHEPWDGTVEQVIRRIDTQWSALGHHPTLGDVCWFATTQQGDAYAAPDRPHSA